MFYKVVKPNLGYKHAQTHTSLPSLDKRQSQLFLPGIRALVAKHAPFEVESTSVDGILQTLHCFSKPDPELIVWWLIHMLSRGISVSLVCLRLSLRVCSKKKDERKGVLLDQQPNILWVCFENVTYKRNRQLIVNMSFKLEGRPIFLRSQFSFLSFQTSLATVKSVPYA